MNKIARQLLALGIFLLALMGGTLALVWRNLPPQIPWYYSLPSGEQQLVDKSVLIWSLAGSLVLLILTKMMAVWAGKKDATVEITIMMGGVVAILLVVATFWRIMQIFVGL